MDFYPVLEPAHQIINMPALSPTMTQGNIGTWRKKEGEPITAGDVLVEIETDKATMDFECQEEGYLAKILVPEGTKEWKVGQPVAVLVEEKADVAAFKDFKVGSPKPAVPKEDPANSDNGSITAPISTVSPISMGTSISSGPSTGSRVLASPVAKYLAKDHNIDLSRIHGSGPNSRILKHDVLDAIQNPPPSAPTMSPSFSGQPFVDLPLTSMRKIIAQRLSESKQTIPHYYLTSDIDMTRTINLRKQLNSDADGAFKISLNDIIIKACAMAMKHVPEVNSAWHGTFIRQHNKVDISVAVATDAGLITPIIADANMKGLQEISSEVKKLAALAKQNKLRPEQFQGGTFTISNLGMFGSVSSFTAIINTPQSCILAVGGTQKRLVPESNGAIREAEFMQVTMSCDHRVVDGATGAKWLVWLKKYLEDPALMLM